MPKKIAKEILELVPDWFHPVLPEIRNIYEQSFRKYHNWEHIEEMFTLYKTYRERSALVSDCKQVTPFAILFHDIVYFPGCKSNEENSAKLAEFYLRPFEDKGVVEPIVLDYVTRSILATQNHFTFETENDTYRYFVDYASAIEILLDLDLARLAYPYEVFRDLNQKLRQEYFMYSDIDWLTGRIKFLQTLKDRFDSGGELFRTVYFGNEFNDQAHENVNRYLKELCKV